MELLLVTNDKGYLNLTSLFRYGLILIEGCGILEVMAVILIGFLLLIAFLMYLEACSISNGANVTVKKMGEHVFVSPIMESRMIFWRDGKEVEVLGRIPHYQIERQRLLEYFELQSSSRKSVFYEVESKLPKLWKFKEYEWFEMFDNDFRSELFERKVKRQEISSSLNEKLRYLFDLRKRCAAVNIDFKRHFLDKKNDDDGELRVEGKLYSKDVATWGIMANGQIEETEAGSEVEFRKKMLGSSLEISDCDSCSFHREALEKVILKERAYGKNRKKKKSGFFFSCIPKLSFSFRVSARGNVLAHRHNKSKVDK